MEYLQMKPLSIIDTLIVKFLAVCEKDITGKKMGDYRMKAVSFKTLEYLKNKNVAMDDDKELLILKLI